MRLVMAVLLLGLCVATHATEQAAPVQTLQQLLDRVKQGQVQEAENAAAREAQFLEDRDQQQAALKKLKRSSRKLERRASELEQAQQLGAQHIEAQRLALQKRLDTLGPIFANLGRTGETTAGVFSQALSASEFGSERVAIAERLQALGQGGLQLPAMADLEGLWYELQRELVAGGAISSYQADVLAADGTRTRSAVVRVGSFNIVQRDGSYLQHEAGSDALQLMPRQPGAGAVHTAAGFATATDGFARFGIDPTGAQGGAFLKALVQRPTLWERLAQGGWLGWLILIMGAGGSGLFVLSLGTARPAQLSPDVPAIKTLKLMAIVAVLGGVLGTARAVLHNLGEVAQFGSLAVPDMAALFAADLINVAQGLSVALLLLLLRAILVWQANRTLLRVHGGEGG